MQLKKQLTTALLVLCSTGAALAQDAAALNARSLAASCASCHGTEGRPVSGSTLPALAGLPKSYLLAQMNAFKDGSRPATVMHQLSKGLTEQQIDSLATYFAAIAR